MTERHQLSAQDRDVLERARVEWAALAFSTAPAERPRAEAAMVAMYCLVGKAPPRFQWVSHPGELIADLPRHHRLVAPSNPLVAWALQQPMRQIIGAIIDQGAATAYSEAANEGRGRAGRGMRDAWPTCCGRGACAMSGRCGCPTASCRT